MTLGLQQNVIEIGGILSDWFKSFELAALGVRFPACPIFVKYWWIMFLCGEAQVPLPYLFAKEGNSKGKGIFTLLPFLCKPPQLPVCVFVCVSQFVCPAFPPCMYFRPFLLICWSTHQGITGQIKRLITCLVLYFCRLSLKCLKPREETKTTIITTW